MHDCIEVESWADRPHRELVDRPDLRIDSTAVGRQMGLI
jgi:hypothetical protein